MSHVRLVKNETGRFAVVTDFLGNPLSRLDCQAAGIKADPADLSEAEAKILAARMDRWIEEQNQHATRKQKTGNDSLRVGPDVLL